MNTNHQPNNLQEIDEARLTAYALGQLDDVERQSVEARLQRDPEARRAVDETRRLAAALRQALQASPAESSPALRAALEQQFQHGGQPPAAMPVHAGPERQEVRPRWRGRSRWLAPALAVCLVLGATVALLGPVGSSGRRMARVAERAVATSPAADAESGEVETRTVHSHESKAPASSLRGLGRESEVLEAGQAFGAPGPAGGATPRRAGYVAQGQQPMAAEPVGAEEDLPDYQSFLLSPKPASPPMSSPPADAAPARSLDRGYVVGKKVVETGGRGERAYPGMAGSGGQREGGYPSMAAPSSIAPMRPSSPAPEPTAPPAQPGRSWSYVAEDELSELSAAPDAGGERERLARSDGSLPALRGAEGRLRESPTEDRYDTDPLQRSNLDSLATLPGGETYAPIVENPFVGVTEQPVSTFSIDVDTASYANVRRFLRNGQLPPPDAVRVEEMVNYFRYDYPEPEGGAPFAVHLEAAQCPWQPEHRLLRVGLKGKEVHRKERGASNLVFLIDVSGSMSDANKLPLVKAGMTALVEQLGKDDRVAIVTYAGQAGLKLESTPGNQREKIVQAIQSLSAGGSTAGSAGIMLAYEQATGHFIREGNNRVILATDGDLNVGITRDDQLVQLIEAEARTGVFLTVLGFGTGNLQDGKLEKLADHGNGMYAYIDDGQEARRVLVEQMSGSLVTIAKDVKLQIEFNPAEVAAYRLIGYENRVLANADFDDDRKDAGEIGAGHTATALYELIPAGSGSDASGGGADTALRYQRPQAEELTDAARSGELAQVRLRYKQPDADESRLLEFTVSDASHRFGQASPEFQFASAVAALGMVLRGSQYCPATLSAVEEYAAGGLSHDPGGYRAEFLELVRRAQSLRP